MMEGCVVWLTGLPCSGKTTISIALAEMLRGLGLRVEVLDGDEVRRSLSAGLGYSAEDRQEHNRRVIYVSKLLMRNGVVVIVPLISPYRKTRDYARQELGRFLEVYVKCPIEECIRRDVKGHYAKALRGEIDNFTGVSDPYEEPIDSEVTVHTDRETIDESVEKIMCTFEQVGYLDGTVACRDHPGHDRSRISTPRTGGTQPASLPALEPTPRPLTSAGLKDELFRLNRARQSRLARLSKFISRLPLLPAFLQPREVQTGPLPGNDPGPTPKGLE